MDDRRIPEGWRECRLGDVAEIVKDKYQPKKGDALIYIGLEHIQEQTLRLNSIGSSEDITSDKFYFRKGDVLFGKLRPYFRKVVQVDFDGVCSTDIWVIRPKAGVNQKYLLYLFANKELVDLSNFSESGTRMPRADWNFMSQTIWNIPIDQSEQHAIASVLSSLDDKIDLLNRENQTLEQMAEALFRQWFIEEADEKWEEVPLSEVFDFKEGPGIRNWQYRDNGIPFINIRLISNGEIDVSKANFVSEAEANAKYKHFYLQRKDMVVSTSGTLGKVAIIRNYHLPLLLNTSVIRFRPKDGINFSFMYGYLRSNEFYECLIDSASGSVQLNFGPIHLKQIVMKIPPNEKLEYFRKVVDPIYEKFELNYNQIRTLEKLRDTLLPKLMSGEVRVKLTDSEVQK